MKNFALMLLFCALGTAVFSQNRRTNSKPKTSSETVKPKASETKKEESKSSSTSDNGSSSFLSPTSPLSIMSTNIELGGYPSDAGVSYVNMYGLLGLNFDISRRIYVGPYFRHKILSTTDYQVMNIEGKSLDLASFKEWGAGLTIGSYLPLGKTLLLCPELRIGYNEYTIQDISYTSTNKNFLNHNFVNFTPRLNIGFKMSDYTVLNFSGGYILPYYLKGAKSTDAYNPGTFMYGLGIRFYMSK